MFSSPSIGSSRTYCVARDCGSAAEGASLYKQDPTRLRAKLPFPTHSPTTNTTTRRSIHSHLYTVRFSSLPAITSIDQINRHASKEDRIWRLQERCHRQPPVLSWYVFTFVSCSQP